MPSVDKLDELYKVLEVPRNADASAIKASYRKLVLKYHPDKNPEDREAAEQKIRAINNAYEVLGNIAKRNAMESQAAAINTARARQAPVGLPTVEEQRTADVVLPRSFMICPMGHPDRFLRAVDRSFVFQSRSDVKGVDFEGFFEATRFGMNWLPNHINPDRFPKFRCPCHVQNIRDYMGSTNVGMANSYRNSKVEAPIVGVISFGLSPGVSSSDLMMANTSSPHTVNLYLSPSPNYPNAYRFEAEFFGNHFMMYDPPTYAQISGAPDSFSVMDFLVIPAWDCMHFQTIDDVMIPAVRNLGGDKQHVKLTAVCEDVQVRSYFQRNGIFDFEDFAAYFHAHSETWDYKPEQLSLRLRGPDEVVESRSTTKREAPADLSVNHCAKQAKIETSNREPTRVVCLTNLVGAGEVDEDLQEETADEAKKYGNLKGCVIKELKDVPDDQAVRIFLEFETTESASKAFK
eukprot:CAMPEP_0169374942 /NCGR_PEP_ID=MMETSP1017-20121227/37826_1 /TAXON_ID=342587 /ORGANISM="Karlodinium micrum, Strain CCMP2283" /LENGTH=460 /DNA_ID=CAMNT_0009473793 /DNA_START=53 /DNA_END=1432 /DNA_ORIENTATION=+